MKTRISYFITLLALASLFILCIAAQAIPTTIDTHAYFASGAGTVGVVDVQYGNWHVRDIQNATADPVLGVSYDVAHWGDLTAGPLLMVDTRADRAGYSYAGVRSNLASNHGNLEVNATMLAVVPLNHGKAQVIIEPVTATYNLGHGWNAGARAVGNFVKGCDGSVAIGPQVGYKGAYIGYMCAGDAETRHDPFWAAGFKLNL